MHHVVAVMVLKRRMLTRLTIKDLGFWEGENVHIPLRGKLLFGLGV